MLIIIALIITSLFFPFVWFILAAYVVYLIFTKKQRRNRVMMFNIQRLISTGQENIVINNLYYESAKNFAADHGATIYQNRNDSRNDCLLFDMVIGGEAYRICVQRWMKDGTLLTVKLKQKAQADVMSLFGKKGSLADHTKMRKDALSDSYLPSVPKIVYENCLYRYDLSVENVNEVYRTLYENIKLLVDRAVLDDRFEDEEVNSVISIAIKLLYDEYISILNENRSVEKDDTYFLTGKEDDNVNIGHDFFYCYYKALNSNCRESQYGIANYYEYGSNVKKNYTQMFKWYELSANNGYIPSMLEMSAQSGFRKSDLNTSIDWLVKAAELNSCEAYVRLFEILVDPLLKLSKEKKHLYDRDLSLYCLSHACLIDIEKASELFFSKHKNSDEEEHHFDMEKAKSFLTRIDPEGKLNLRNELMKLRMKSEQ